MKPTKMTNSIKWRPALGLVVAIVALLADGSSSNFELEMLISRDIQGAAFPVDKYGMHCNVAELSNQCKCTGGAARRETVFSEARAAANLASNTDLVAIDTGGYFYGTGLFYPTFGGTASSLLMANTRYDATGLTFRDFVADHNGNGTTLATFLEAAGITGVATNMDVSTLPSTVLSSTQHVSAYTLSPLQVGIRRSDTEPDQRMAFLSLMDPSFLDPSYKAISNAPYMEAAKAALAEIYALPPDEQPAVVVMSVARITTTKSDNEAEQMLYGLASQLARNVDIIIAHGFGDDFDDKGGHSRTNWIGDEVLIVPAGDALGKHLTSVTVKFKATGDPTVSTSFTLEKYAVTRIDLNCSVAEDPAVQTKLLAYQTVIQERNTASTFGILGETFRGEEIMDATACASRTGGDRKSEAKLIAGNLTVCGCRVAECGAGKLITDALQWYTGADIAVHNSGAIRESFPAGAVSRGDVLSVLPFDEQLAMLELTGTQVLEMLRHSLSGMHADDVASNPEGRFLQVSSTVVLRWHFKDGRAHVRNVKVAAAPGAGSNDGCSSKTTSAARANTLPVLGTDLFRPLEPTRMYCVATSTFLANGNDGYSMLAAAGYSPGHSFLEAVGLYIETFSSTSSAHPVNHPGGMAMVPATAPPTQLGPRAGRFVQSSTVVQLNLGLLCDHSNSGGTDRESCDHMLHTIDMINDKTDGFYDELLKHAHIHVVETECGCSEGICVPALKQLQKHLPNMTAAIGPSCSSDVVAVSSIASRAETGYDGMFISSSSTAPSAANDVEYPLVSRAATNEKTIVAALATFVSTRGWEHIGVLHDDSVWGAESAEWFVKTLTDINDAAGKKTIVLNHANKTISAQTTGFSYKTFMKTPEESARAELLKLRAANVRITAVFTQPNAQRWLFRVSFNEQINFGKGYLWMSTWMTESAFYDPNTNEVDYSAVRGAEGLCGIVYGLPAVSSETASKRKAYYTRWATKSNQNGCKRYTTVPGTHSEPLAESYCDADGDASAFPSYSYNQIDGIVSYAKAMDRQYLTAPLDAKQLYQNVLNITFDGLTGKYILDPDSGDLAGGVSVKNMQFDHDNSNRTQTRNRGRRVISLSETKADFVTIGSYIKSQGLILFNDTDIMYAGPTREQPIDKEKPVLSNSTHTRLTSNILNDKSGIYVGIALGMVVLIISIVLLLAARKQFERKRLDIAWVEAMIKRLQPDDVSLVKQNGRQSFVSSFSSLFGASTRQRQTEEEEDDDVQKDHNQTRQGYCRQLQGGSQSTHTLPRHDVSTDLSKALFLVIEHRRHDLTAALLECGADSQKRHPVKGLLPHTALLQQSAEGGLHTIADVCKFAFLGAGSDKSLDHDDESDQANAKFEAAYALFNKNLAIDVQIGATIEGSGHENKEALHLLKTVLVRLAANKWLAHDNSGETVAHKLMIACQNSSLHQESAIALVAAVIEADATIMLVPDSKGVTPSDIAVRCRHYPLVVRSFANIVFGNLLLTHVLKPITSKAHVYECKDLRKMVGRFGDGGAKTCAIKLYNDWRQWKNEIEIANLLTELIDPSDPSPVIPMPLALTVDFADSADQGSNFNQRHQEYRHAHIHTHATYSYMHHSNFHDQVARRADQWGKFSKEQCKLIDKAFRENEDFVRLPDTPFEVRFGRFAVSDTVRKPPVTGMLQVNINTQSSRVVRRAPKVQVDVCDSSVLQEHVHAANNLMREFNFAVVMPLAGRSLRELIMVERMHEEPLDTIRDDTRKIAMKIKILHDIGFIHGDLKPSKILLYNRDMVLSDLGMCYKLPDPSKDDVAEDKDPPHKIVDDLKDHTGYICPELVFYLLKMGIVGNQCRDLLEGCRLERKLKVMRQGKGEEGHGSDDDAIELSCKELTAATRIQRWWREIQTEPFEKLVSPRQVDLWAFALILYEIVVGRALFPNSAESVSTEGLNSRFPWNGLTPLDIKPIEDSHGRLKSAAIVDLLKWSLEPDPQSRPDTFDELLSHAFFNPVKGAMREHFIVDQIKSLLAEPHGNGRTLGNVMISYCWADTQFVLNKLALELASKVKGLWLDRLGGDQGMGEWTRASMQRGVAGADVIICVVSPAYIRSVNCGYECSLAAKMGKTIVPICLGVPFEEWPPKMIGKTEMTTQFADGTDIKLFVDFTDMEAFYIKYKKELEPRLMYTDPNRVSSSPSRPARGDTHGFASSVRAILQTVQSAKAPLRQEDGWEDGPGLPLPQPGKMEENDAQSVTKPFLVSTSTPPPPAMRVDQPPEEEEASVLNIEARSVQNIGSYQSETFL